jgi:hypothetical protein
VVDVEPVRSASVQLIATATAFGGVDH